MKVVTLATLVDRLPPGRARSRYERLLAESGGEMMAVTVPYSEATLWLVTATAEAEVLTARGVPRWRIWTFAEAQDLLRACGSAVHTLKQAAGVLRSGCVRKPSGRVRGAR